MNILCWVAVVAILATIYGLIKRWETRLVLIAAGFLLCCVSLQPMAALNAFAKSMTNNSLIMAICGSMGFAFVASYTKCDRSLVYYLSSPIRGLGIFLIPICTLITFLVNIAIPSAAGCAAAVGSTLIPVMLRARIKPAAAAAAVLAGTIGSYLSPGTSHNPFVAKMAGIGVMDFIGTHMWYSIMCGVILIVGTALVCFILGDGKGDENAQVDQSKLMSNDGFKPNPLGALVMIVPIAILVVGNVWVPAIKTGVAQAMLIGAICALLVARADPQQFSREFFKGMGKGYADVLGIIIAAGVFAAGLRTSGLIDAGIAALKESNEFARWGGSLGPWIMGVLSGSGDAATLAFNETVTPHAKDFGMTIESLGGLAFLSGALGRTMSPIAGVTILVSGIAMVNPLEVVKRTCIPCVIAVIACALLMV
ncbi:C4-dicarboxylate transporter DcuC [Mesosutterella sp. OilRF-GAM-744-9]|uniref:C4-dicarboxylate transporter DcuC n=1 Tax=Mesosutterella porci TaxID=2915351 RepID=A0ABS9MNA3_9BURK|nr:C4-dicarboxylate transporter DcuC [Mesosutterella sp. oilRF-744-WT-GAM-9]MCG5030104.1 C4-dicarboxylate transporter DcuC [Mesosutterella sp. oilRF-744-WT-GAM-9]MCI6530450.1 C4-dicarboxylate transporter DcuC [Mesosutterella sp.]